mmetsp:Transcript_143/g.532  ORF Transcript_143/g.532 Transcript_143/m.532 type:complete len:216 (+) Transcript_143:1209-1856(+)
MNVIEQGLDHPVEHHAPSVLVEDSAAVLAQAIEDPVQRCCANVSPGIAHEHRQAPEDGEPMRRRVAGAGLRDRLCRAAANAREGAQGRRRRLRLRLVGQVLCRLQEVGDRLQGYREVGLALPKAQEAPHAVGEVLYEEVVAHLHDLLDAGKGALSDGIVAVTVLLSSPMKDVEYSLPTGLDVVDPHVNHVGDDRHDEVLDVSADPGRGDHDLKWP